MKNKIDKKEIVKLDGKEFKVSRRQARQLERLKKRIEKSDELSKMTDEEKSSWIKNSLKKIGIPVGAGLAILFGVLMLTCKSKSDQTETVLLEENDISDDSDDSGENDSEIETGEF